MGQAGMCARSPGRSSRHPGESRAEAPDMAAPSRAIDRQEIKGKVRARLLGLPFELDRLTPPERRLRVREEVLAVLRESRAILPAGDVASVVNEISDEVVGLGPIERLLKDPE